ncbi:anthranilate phosphoribosyltransferase [Prochlorococcus marinus]|uniref:Anthranilate phosphoribosyltransferase n=1 Tax=Prochlorococcus marinus XMU1408 TaxID=2213228 RepID=A0A318R5F9_PROMR|nr:anthranilate phosphoribosyltransferase [Prochlorococcus marinus]MBW3041887.1 anthranilate phosphoribosyltransferase [Prochlorococcus marinus str. XMU1408]PYE03018.1 anthranilate phosphoribosyltransferase [Prochlorococcus marinus XMU1408]
MSSSFPITFPLILESLLSSNDLTSDQVNFLMNSWLENKIEPVQTGAFLAAFRAKGISGDELSVMAKILQDASKTPLNLPSFDLVDTCGTGGDGANTFNISTAVAFVSAALGVKIAKHGNRSASGKVGSADVLENLGLPLKVSSENVIEALKTFGITFLFAPSWHPSLVNLAPLRKSLGVRTIFNLLGPLVNPLRPKSQVLGVAKSNLLEPMSIALKGMGLKRAVVVHGAGGLDEASLAGENEFRFLDNNSIRSEIIHPSDIGLDEISNESLKGDDLQTNSNILMSLLKGEGNKYHKEVVALNTALVLWASGFEDNLSFGVKSSLDCLNTDKSWLLFEELRDFLAN